MNTFEFIPGKTFFRFHRGSLKESLETEVTMDSLEELQRFLEGQVTELFSCLCSIDHYGYDDRVKQDLWLVRAGPFLRDERDFEACFLPRGFIYHKEIK